MPRALYHHKPQDLSFLTDTEAPLTMGVSKILSLINGLRMRLLGKSCQPSRSGLVRSCKNRSEGSFLPVYLKTVTTNSDENCGYKQFEEIALQLMKIFLFREE